MITWATVAKEKTPSVQAEGLQKANQAADNTDFKPGALPLRKDTVIAEVLANLLGGRRLTGMEAVFGMSSTRLSHHIWALGRDHGWNVGRCDKVVGTNDGRVQTISEYWLPPTTIDQAMQAGAGVWVEEVRRLRLARRKNAAEARKTAELFDTSKRLARLINPAQFTLFGGGHV